MRTRLLVLAPIAIAATLLAGCTTKSPGTAGTPTPTDNGIAALSASEILDKARTALGATSSFHVKGTMTEDGAATEIDMQIVPNKDAMGTIKVQGYTINLIKKGSAVYLKSDDFWTQFVPAEQQAALALIKGKYVKVDASNAAFSGFGDLTDPAKVLAPQGTPTKGNTTTVNGTPAIGIVDSQDNSTLYIATVGQPLPIKIEGASSSTLEFSDYNAPLTVSEPAATDVVDLSALTGGH